MNCKQGDLAICVNPISPNFGKLLRVTAPHLGEVGPDGAYYADSPHASWICHAVSPVGLTITKIDGKRYGPYPWTVFKDRSLRPIRDTDGTDETLSWKDVPHKEVA